LDKLIANGMSEKDFQATRNYLTNYAPQLVASQDQQLGYALDSEFYKTDEFVQYVRGQFAKLSLADVNRVIKENLQTDDIQYVFISGDGEDMKKRLLSEQVSPLKYNSEKPAELLATDKIIESYKLTLPSKNVEVIAIDSVFE
jgi:zinc protease